MHADEIAVDLDLASRLVAEQFPQWQDEPVSRVAAAGTVNATFRIGSALSARFPLRAADPDETATILEQEAAAMAEFAACCPFPTPRHIAFGRPGHGFPLPWSVQTWLPGDVATPDGLADSAAFAQDLGTLIGALRRADTCGRTFAGAGRGGRLAGHDDWIGACFDRSGDLVDVPAARALWARLRTVPSSGPDVMSHGDLIPANLLVSGQHLVGVIDAGGFGPADPALDLVAAWHLLGRDGRQLLRTELGCTNAEWLRGAAWALQQAMGLVWYYRATNPVMSELGRSTVTRLVTDTGLLALLS